MPTLEPLYRVKFGAAELREHYPPRFSLDHKRNIYEEFCPDGCQRGGWVEVSRWNTMAVVDVGSETHPKRTVCEGGYEYEKPPPGWIAWHVNFAAGDLFAYYADRCFAQDEIQVFEHPALGAVREALLATGRSTRVTDNGASTPFLIRGAERRLAVQTEPASDGPWPHGLYGRQFHRAPIEVVRRAIRSVEPPLASDILVIEAPCGGYGFYQPDEIEWALSAAYTGFRAAQIESERSGMRCAIHTGFWGCGAYGGNPELMVSVQLLGARLAGVDELVFYLWDDAGLGRYERGRRIADEVLAAMVGMGVEERAEWIMGGLLARRFQWGMSDGN